MMGDESNILVVVIIRPRHDDNLVVVGIPAPPNPPNPTLPPPPPSPPPPTGLVNSDNLSNRSDENIRNRSDSNSASGNDKRGDIDDRIRPSPTITARAGSVNMSGAATTSVVIADRPSRRRRRPPPTSFATAKFDPSSYSHPSSSSARRPLRPSTSASSVASHTASSNPSRPNDAGTTLIRNDGGGDWLVTPRPFSPPLIVISSIWPSSSNEEGRAGVQHVTWVTAEISLNRLDRI